MERDLIVPEDIAWTHRLGELGELPISSPTKKDETRTFTASMRINGKKPECWNPVTGEMNIHPSYRINGNRTEVTLTLAPNESVFIVYPAEEYMKAMENPSPTAKGEKKDTAKEPLNIALEAKEYTITFAANKNAHTKKLFDWSQESDEQIRYYSGTATYKTTFRWKNKPNKDQQIYLNLGTVYNLATVRVNGVDCGTI